MNKKELLQKCLIKLALKSGFDSFNDFRKFKENECNDKDYVAVFPDIQVISTTDDKVYVDNLKIMTAQNLYDSKSGEIIKLTDKLSKNLNINEPPIGWWASEKWDGIRALWDGEKIISRGSGLGKPKVYTYVPEWFRNTLPPGVALDGEIWIGRGYFQKTSRLSTIKPGKSYTEEQINDIWSGKNDPPVIFKVFDIPSSDLNFENRMTKLKTVIESRRKCWNKINYSNKKVFPLQFTEQIKIETPEQLYNLYKNLTKEGAEGIMLRAPKSPYELKRSKYMLKYKIKEDAECIVVDYMMGDGRLTGMLGSLKCELLNNEGEKTGVITQIGTGFTDSQRENYSNKNSKEYIPIGSIVSFSFMEMTKDGIPRHPVYRGIREDIKIPKPTISTKYVKDTLSKLMSKVSKEKEQNWQFKIKFYKQAIDILKDDAVLNTTEDYISYLRNGGMLLKDEENFKAKTGSWKSSIIQKIDIILKTGKLEGVTDNLENLAIENLSKIPGIGPSNASKLYKDEGITTIEDLRNVYKINKKILNSKQEIGLIHYEDLQKRIPKQEMDIWNKILEDAFKKIIKDENINGIIKLTGSYRRQKQDSGDIDVLISTDKHDSKIMEKFYNELLKQKIIDKNNTIAKGNTKIMAVANIDDTFRHLDIFYYTKEVYPFALLFTTGSKELNTNMRSHALKKGYSLNEKNLTHNSPSGREVNSSEYMSKIGKVKPETEEDIFKFLDYKYIPPKDR